MQNLAAVVPSPPPQSLTRHQPVRVRPTNTARFHFMHKTMVTTTDACGFLWPVSVNPSHPIGNFISKSVQWMSASCTGDRFYCLPELLRISFFCQLVLPFHHIQLFLQGRIKMAFPESQNGGIIPLVVHSKLIATFCFLLSIVGILLLARRPTL
jgi:hypothetical protein